MADPSSIPGALEYSYPAKCTIPADGKSIRLVHILPDPPDQPIRISIQRCSLKDASESTYDALSYVWGSAPERIPILCDDSLVYVTANLHAALRRLRHPHIGESTVLYPNTLSPEVSAIWIDALCINQADDAERTAQVRMMDQIYSAAGRVIVWLGEEDDGRHAELAFMGLEIFAGNRIYHGSKKQYVLPGQPDHNLMLHVRKLLERPWFTRIWVVQEVVLARNARIMCGPHTMSWDLLHEALIGLSIYEFASGLKALEFMNFRIIFTMTILRDARQSNDKARIELGEDGSRLTVLLPSARSSEATDARDKVFALLGIAKEKGPLEADYQKTVREVYLEVAWTLIRETKSLEVLTLTSFTHRAQDLPTWVPDWRTPFNMHAIAWGEDRTHTRYAASGGMGMEILDTGDSAKLSLLGIQFDKVDTVLHGQVDHISPEVMNLAVENKGPGDDIFHIFQAMAESYGLSGTYEPTIEPMGLAYLRTLCADLLPQAGRMSEGLTKLYFSAYLQHYELSEPTIETSWIGLSVRMVKEVMEKVRDVTRDRCAVLTSTGYLALAPEGACKGDCICILGGADAPVLLRPSGEEFEYLGECFVHGIMDGEFSFLSLLQGDLSKEIQDDWNATKVDILKRMVARHESQRLAWSPFTLS